MGRRPLPLSLLLALLALLCLAAAPAGADGDRDPGGEPCDPEQPVCLLDSGVEPVVSLRWAELGEPQPPRWLHRLPPRWRALLLHWWRAFHPPRTSAVVKGRATLEAVNETRRTVWARVALQPWGLRREARLPEFELALGPRESRRLPVDLEALGFDLSRPHALAGVRAVVQSFAEGGRSHDSRERLDQTFSPVLYLLRRDPRMRTLRVFGESQLDRFVNTPAQQQSGSPFCTLTLGDPDGEEDLELAIDPGPGDPEPGQVFTTDPPPPAAVKFCFALPVDTKDSGIGEDWATLPTSNFPASHAQVTISTLPPGVATIIDEEYLDEEGCIQFPHVSPAGYFVKLTGKALVPQTDDPLQSNMLTVQTVQLGPPLELGIPAWYWCSDEDLEGGEVKWFYANPNRRTNLLAMSIFSLVRFSDGVGGQNIFVQDRPCSTDDTNSCNTGPGSTIQVHPDHNQYRYAVSHEMGHRILFGFLGQNHPLLCGSYAVNEGGDACEWDLSHALHSKEFAVGAFNEGFAQFYATAVYNDLSDTDAWFHYYKDDYKDGAVKVVDMEGEASGGQTAYLDTVCEGTEEGFGVELDWARAFWDYMTDAGLVKPTRRQLLEQIELAWESDWNLGNASERMEDVTMTHAGGAYADRWLDAAEHNGVDPSFTDDCFWTCMVSCETACTGASCPCSACTP